MIERQELHYMANVTWVVPLVVHKLPVSEKKTPGEVPKLSDIARNSQILPQSKVKKFFPTKSDNLGTCPKNFPKTDN